MRIQQDILELKELEIEIKRLSKRLRVLRQQKQKCESRILEYLDANEQPGVKCQGMTIIAQDHKKRPYRPKSEKYHSAQLVMERMGIQNSKEALDDILEAMRGSPQYEPKLRIL